MDKADKVNTLKLEAINLTRQQLQAEIDLANETSKSLQERQKLQKKLLQKLQQVAGFLHTFFNL